MGGGEILPLSLHGAWKYTSKNVQPAISLGTLQGFGVPPTLMVGKVDTPHLPSAWARVSEHSDRSLPT